MLKKLLRILLPIFLFAACTSAGASSPKNEDAPSVEESQPEIVSTEPLATAPAEPFRPLAQTVNFLTSDGTQLEGIFYPPENDDAPLIILMHWARGDQNDYAAIADWLQNRGGEPEMGNDGQNPYLDASWFPKLDSGVSYGVFTFSFRDCDGGCANFHSAEWLDDAQSAVKYARGLPYIDPQRILIAGASIGADGAADSCLYLNQQAPASCKGAFSISPGSYLTKEYADVVARMDAPAVCLYASNDSSAVAACEAFQVDNYTSYEIGNAHGMDLIDPQVQPNPLELLLAFILENTR